MNHLLLITFLIFICFYFCHTTAGDSSLQRDSNTVVGKPQLGKKRKKICKFPCDFRVRGPRSGGFDGVVCQARSQDFLRVGAIS